MNDSEERGFDAGMKAALRELEQEIRERRRSEESLRESERKYRSVIENIQDVFYRADRQDRILMGSPSGVAMFGYDSVDEMIGMPFDRFWTDPKARERLLARIQNYGSVKDFETVLARKDGTTFDAAFTTHFYYGEKGELLGTEGIIRDITERKRVEEALRDKEEFIRALLDASRDWIWAIDLSGVHTYSNPAVKTILGYDAEDLVGSSSFSLMCEEDRSAADDQVKQCIEGKRGWSGVVLRWRHRDGSYRYLESNAVPILDAGGGVIGFRGVDRDITERKHAEEERLELERRLLHGQKLESLGVLAGGIAHDFNNLLMAVLGNLDMALMDLPPLSPARESIGQAIQATRRATDLTREMLAYSGKGRFVLARFGLGELVRQNAELFRTAISRNITLNLSLAPDRTLIEADPGQVQQIIMNLLTNASEAIHEKQGVITLATGVEECNAAYLSRSRLAEKPAAGRFAYMEVSDTGCGMTAETQQRLFDPFFTTKFTGRGLGMSAVLGIVRGHKGAIFVESEVGKETRIRVLFPVCEGESDAPEESLDAPLQEPGLETGSRAVLVADDEEGVRHLCLDFIGRLGFTGIGASNGREALELFEKHAEEIAFVLLDLTMPLMDGVTTFRKMKLLRPEVRVILTSGYTEQDATQRFTGEGLAGFIQKPYRLQELREKIVALSRGPTPS